MVIFFASAFMQTKNFFLASLTFLFIKFLAVWCEKILNIYLKRRFLKNTYLGQYGYLKFNRFYTER